MTHAASEVGETSETLLPRRQNFVRTHPQSENAAHP